MNTPFPQPVTPETFQPELELRPITPLPSKTALLRQVVPHMERLICLAAIPGEVTIATKTVNTAKAEIRAADPLALRVTVQNSGGQLAQVLEGGVIVSVVPAGQQRQLPERGKLKLEALTLAGSTYLTILTHQRGACGDVVEFLAPDNEPVGSFLL